jgi:cysteine synthase B
MVASFRSVLFRNLNPPKVVIIFEKDQWIPMEIVATKARPTASQLVHDPGSILSRIGNTPLIQIRSITRDLEDVEIYAKAEWFNPGGSVKDRAALNMILEGEKSGALTKDKTIIDATSGNTGIAYAMIAAALGYKVILALPSNASIERRKILNAYGAELVLTDPLEGTDGAQLKVKEMVEAEPQRYFFPDQYNNAANWKAHYETTAPEIFKQTAGRVSCFVAGLGTSGTFVGVTRRLKEYDRGIQCISLQPDSPLHGLEGMKHMATAIVPGIYDSHLADENLEVSTEEAYKMIRRLANEEGLFVGISSGAAMAASLRIATELSEGIRKPRSSEGPSVIVTVFPDGGDKYLSDRFWEEK